MTGRIDPEYDIDMFKLDLSGETEPTTVRLYSSGDIDGIGRLYDSDETLLQSSSYHHDYDFQIVDTLPSGVYYVSVETYSYYSSVGDYTLHAEEVPSDDHANTTDGATAITLGSSVTGGIDPEFDKDFFVLDLSDAEGQTNVSIYTTGDLDTYGQLYDSNEERIAYSRDSDFGDDDNFHLRANLASGIYYVEVRSSSRSTGDYVLRAETVPEHGDTAETATDLGLDSPTPGSIVSSEDADYFKLDFSERKSLIVRASSLDYGRLDVTAFDSDGNEVSVNTFPYGYVYGSRIEDDFGPGASYLRLTSPDSSDDRSVHYNIHAVEDAEYTEYVEGCEAETNALNNEAISDPLYACQWHQNSEHEGHINVESVWEEGIKGEGVNVAVVDNGLYHAHEDLKDNVDTSLNHDYTGNEDVYGPHHHHGTHVAGLIAARDNDVGVRGVAPRATIYGYNFLVYATYLNGADALARERTVTAVSSNSWGRAGYAGLTPIPLIWELAIDAGIAEGYDGKGTFYAFSAGNRHLGGDNANFSELKNYYGVTAVCAVNDHDVRSAYSEMGANLWVCAPSNDTSDEHRGILTTENSDRYYEEFGGTSAAAPIVSGVAALLRGANSDLTWRDLKLILAGSARKNDTGNTGWEDGASKYGMDPDTEFYHFNHEYGFGVVDAAAAVELAEDWSLVPALQSSTVESEELNLEIPNPPDEGGEPTTITTTLTLDTSIGFVEYVEVNFDFENSSIRNWDVELVSPSGAVSKLVPGYESYTYYASSDSGDSNDSSDVVPSHYYPPPPTKFRFGSARHLGEDPSGEWQLRITDRLWYGTGTLGSWSLTVYGHERTPGPPYIDWVTPDSDSLTVSWIAPDQTGGLEFTDYDLRYIRTGADETVDENWIVVEDIWSASTGGDLEYTVNGLSDGVQYDLQVRAVNSAGGGDWSRSFTATATRSLCSTDGAVADAASNPGLVSDCEALLAGRDTLVGSGALNWTADTPITDWDGIPSLENQRVAQLYLQGMELNGSLPAELGVLPRLQWLYLQDNDLSGEIPAEMGRLTGLQRLLVYENGLSGPIPGALGDIHDLERLSLYGNGLSGEIPAGLGNASNLKHLLLQDNELSGEIPAELGTLTSLTHMVLNNNSLVGEIPHELGNLPNLEWLYLSGNSLTGCIPEQLRHVERHDFGELDNVICDFDALAALYDAADGDNWENNENWMSDRPVSEWYGVTTDEMGRVSVLDLRSNELSGEIPAELGGLDKLESLELQINELSGEIPAELSSLSSLSRLVLHTNKLTGEIPRELGDLTNLSMLRLDENMLTGGIPTELSNLSFLRDLELWKNNLTGEIPAELGNLFNLSVLALWGNQLTGEIPDELGRLTNLRWLWLHDNQLSGGIPSELGNIHFLSRLDLSMNDLTGEIPSEFGDLANLWSLNLSQNRLTGPILVEPGDYDNLSEMNLSQNQLTGEIPAEIRAIRSLRNLDLSQNQLTGTILVESGDYNNLSEMNLSQNQLTGEIPAEIRVIRYLRVLDLAENDLTGEIPVGLSTLQFLRGLYLSGNLLTGCVPSELRAISENDFENIGLPFCDVLLSALTISPRSLIPSFDPYVTSYTAIEGSSSVTVAPVNDHGATFRFLDQDGNEIADLDDSQDGLQTNLDADITDIRVVVTSEDGEAIHTYGIRVAPLTVPGPPSIISVALDVDSLTVTWVPPLDNGGAEIESYDLRYIQTDVDETVESNWTVMDDVWNAPSDEGLMYAINGLTGGLSYDIQVRAKNSIGTSPWSNTKNETPIPSSVCIAEGAVTDPLNTGLVNDCEALLEGRDTLAGTGSLNWSASTSITEWDGIDVEGDHPSLEGSPVRVTRLFLQSKGLDGTITPKLTDLDNLKWLYLYDNELTGEIPSGLGYLTNLERLYLHDNGLTGEIPEELGSLPKLKRLYLHGNDLTGDIPSELGELSALTHLNLLDNNLGGEIPSELGDLSNLVWLALYGNMLNGEIPSELGNLTNLERLYLHRNSLTGAIPSRLGELTALTDLWLSDNELEGVIPVQLENLTNLVRLRLSGGNVFTGCIPQKLADVESNDLGQLSISVCTDS